MRPLRADRSRSHRPRTRNTACKSPRFCVTASQPCSTWRQQFSPFERPEKTTKNIVNNTVVSPWQFSVAYATSLWHRRKTPSRWSDSITPIELAEQSLHPKQSSNPSRKWQKVAVFRGAFEHSYTTVNRPLSAAPSRLGPSLDEISLNALGIMLGSREDWIRTKECAGALPSRSGFQPDVRSYSLIYNMR